MNIKTGYIVWDGKSSEEYGIGVEKHPNTSRPTRKMDIFSVPGRNGDIILPQDAWDNVTESYDIYLNDGISFNETAQTSADDLADWLMSPTGYCKLYDEWEPDSFRLAYFQGPFDVKNIMSVTGRATIKFVCQPQKFLETGQVEIALDSSRTTVWNPTAYKARPIIIIPAHAEATLPYTLTIGVNTVTVNTKNKIIINCEEQDCYDSAGNNMNSYVSLTSGEFPVLSAGSNAATLIDAGSANKSFTMIPNYWRL